MSDTAVISPIRRLQRVPGVAIVLVLLIALFGAIAPGFLSAANVIVNGSVNSGFDQAGGTHVISSELQIAGQGTNFHGYTLNGGRLSVNNISIKNGKLE